MKDFRIFSAALLVLVAAFGFTACEDDDFEDEQPRVAILNLDGPNVTGPIVAAGTHRFGVQFYEEDLEGLDGRELTAIRVFVGLSPVSMRLSVHAGGDVVPGQELSALNILGDITERSFVDYELVTPVTISDDDVLWLVAEVELDREQQVIGCDAGPAVEGGDWLWSGDRWLTYRERTSESINWNIRGVVE